jgi:hypothetical protein
MDRPRSAGVARAGRTALVLVALGAGVVIALVDSSPGWDSTGITAGALLMTAGVTAAVAGDRPWLWALLVGLPTPVLEVSGTAGAASLLALAFASAGAALGWAVARLR